MSVYKNIKKAIFYTTIESDVTELKINLSLNYI